MPYQAARIVLASLGPDDVRSDAVTRELLLSAQRLRALGTQMFDELRRSDLVMDVYVDAGTDGRSLTLEVPTELLFECGRLGLGITLAVHDHRLDF